MSKTQGKSVYRRGRIGRASPQINLDRPKDGGALPLIVRFANYGKIIEARLRIPGCDRTFMGFGESQNVALREMFGQIVQELVV